MTIVDGGNAFSVFTDTLDGGDAFTVYPLEGPELVGKIDMAPCPRVEITLTDLPAGTKFVTVRSTADKVRPVQEAILAPAAGAFFVVDYLAPTGVEVGYWAEAYADADGTQLLATTDTSTITLPMDPTMAVFTDPLDPSASLLVEMKPDFGESASRSKARQMYQVGLRTVVLTGVTSLLQGVNLHCQTKTVADSDVLLELLARPMLTVRSTPEARLPRVLLVSIAEWAEVPVDVQWGGGWSEFNVRGDELSVPILNVIVPVVELGVYEDAFPTLGAFEDAYDTFLDAEKNPPGD